MTSRLTDLIHKCASVEGLTRDERSEWHRLLIKEEREAELRWWATGPVDQRALSEREQAASNRNMRYAAFQRTDNFRVLTPSETAQAVERALGKGNG